MSFTASHADANVSLSSDIAKPLGGGLASATITEHDTNLTNGLDTPGVSLGDLGGFKNIQPQDFMSALASLAVLIQTFEQSGPAAIDLPFLHRDPSADTVLDQIATADTDSDLRRSAASQLGANRGAHGFETLKRRRLQFTLR